MKNNIKLFFKSLVSNNTCIDGGRRKPWYAAIIMFFVSVVLALVPTFVKSIKTKGSDVFATYNYHLAEATMAFEENIKTNGVTFTVENNLASEGEKHLITNVPDYTFTYANANGNDEVKFMYVTDLTISVVDEIRNSTLSIVLFTPDNFYLHLMNFNTKELIKDLGCVKAYKYLDEGFTLNSLAAFKDDSSVDIGSTWNNWLNFYDKAYNFNRLTVLWQQCLIIGGINIVITALMGFMVWILTRGKTNAYRLTFNLWNSQKVAYWAALTPAILTCGLGFLFANFSNVLFPLLIGVRVMWLSMKSLRPDGSGYASN